MFEGPWCAFSVVLLCPQRAYLQHASPSLGAHNPCMQVPGQAELVKRAPPMPLELTHLGLAGMPTMCPLP